MYYRGAHAALLLYDITNAASFEDIRGWLEGIVIVSMVSGETWPDSAFVFQN